MRRIVCMGLALVLLCGCSTALTGCSSRRDLRGFSEELIGMLSETYELAVPETATFRGGYYDNATQDDAIYLAFSLPTDAMDVLLSDNWEETAARCSDDALTELLGTSAQRMYVYHGEMYTYLICSAETDGAVTCAFHGRYPPNIL